MAKLPPCDAMVWLANGLPGIVVGIGHHYVSVLWSNGRVTKVLPSLIVHFQPFTSEPVMSAPTLAERKAWYAARVACPDCGRTASVGMYQTVLRSVPFCDNRTRAHCPLCGWSGLVMNLLPETNHGPQT